MAPINQDKLGKYEIKEFLGKGSMAEVYRAFHPTLERDVAIKVIRPDIASDPQFVTRFKHEAKIVAALHHPNIVQIYDFEAETDIFYMVMQFVPGTNLQIYLQDLYQRGSQMPLGQALSLFRVVVDAVAYAHQQGVMHRDLKPANVLLTPNHTPILADFGLSRIIGSERLFSVGAIVGTPTYMAPEQGNGEAGDMRSDIYSLGVMLYELTTGIPPFTADTPISVILKHIDEPLPPPRTLNPQLPLPVEQLIQKALAKQPKQRFQTAQELAGALSALPSLEQADRTTVPTAADTRPPYRGLQVFEPEHADLFFGREALVSQLVDRFAPTSKRFLAVLGASGSGKSSLVRAGLIPALQNGAVPGSEQWIVSILRPGSQPLQELATRLNTALGNTLAATGAELTQNSLALHHLVQQYLAQTPPEKKLLLVIDQFEEIFTLCRSEAERRRFIENLLYASTVENGRVIVLITMRADFYHRCATHRELASRISAQQLLVGPMSEPELRLAIERPALHVGLKFEPGLVDTILDDVANQPGALPLLQHALLELWERRQTKLLTREAYRASGGVSGAISQRADAIYAELASQEKAIVRKVMLRLTQPGEGTEDTRRRARKQELLPEPNQSPTTEKVLQKLADARLITISTDVSSGQEMVDVAHEALIRGWDQLRTWIDEDRVALHTHRQLTEATTVWEQAGRDPSYLYQGGRLAQALEWAETHAGDLNAQERAFLNASQDVAEAVAREKEQARRRELAQAQALAEAEHQRAEQQSKARKRLLGLAVALAAMVVLAVTGAVLAIQQWQKANRQTDVAVAAQTLAEQEQNRAKQQARLATSRQLAAQALSYQETNPDLAILLALEANQVVTHPVAAGANPILDLRVSPALAAFLHGHQDLTNAVAFNPVSGILASAGDDGLIIFWDVDTRQPLGPPLEGNQNQIVTLAFSPDGKILASAGLDKQITLWDAQTRQPLGPPLTGHTDVINSITFSPDGKILASASRDRTVQLWDVATGQRLVAPLLGHTNEVTSVDFSPDGQTLASAGSDFTIRLWDVKTGEPQGAPLAGHTAVVTDIDFSPNGKQLVSASDDHSVMVWDVATKRPAGPPLTGHSDLVQTVAFSPDGRWIASGSKDKTIRLWDTTTGQLAAPPLQSSDWVRDVAFNNKGNLLASAGDYTPILLWNVSARQYLAGHREWVNSVAFSPDGTLLASGGDDKQVMLWDVAKRLRLRRSFPAYADYVVSVAFSTDGKTLATASFDNRILLLDVNTGKIRAETTEQHSDWVSSLDFSPTQPLLASSSADKTIRLWDATTGQPVGKPLTGHTDAIYKVVFSPDGKLLASGSTDKTVRLWDVETGAPIGSPLTAHTDGVWGLAFSPDGKILASAGDDDTVILWDVQTQKTLGPPLVGHNNDVWGLAFSPDGKILASASRDDTVILWDVKTQKPLGPPLVGHTSWIWGIDYSPTENLIATGSRDANIILWNIDDILPGGGLCQIANRNLTLTEWEQLLPDQPYQKICAGLPADPTLLTTARQQALAGDVEAATATFEQALDLDPQLSLDPRAEAKKFAAQGLLNQAKEAAKTEPETKIADLVEQALALNPSLNLNPKAQAQRLEAAGLVAQGREQARQGDIESALTKFEQASNLDPTLNLTPQAEANRLAAQGQIQQGQELALSGDVEAAAAKFKQALTLNPSLRLQPRAEAEQLAATTLVAQAEQMAASGEITAALATLNQAQTIAPTLDIFGRAWHQICRFGALEQQANLVVDACDRIVELAPYDGWAHDSRGLVRALTGDYAGAIEDFKFFVNWFASAPNFAEYGLDREKWITTLGDNKNPITPEVLEDIRD